MANPNISLLGAIYSGVTGVTLPVSGGGTATFPWVEGSETKTQNGTYDVTSLAQIVVNVSGVGGSGLVYESGTYTPTADVAQPTISFTGTHTDRPFFVLIEDIGGTNVPATDSAIYWCVVSWYDFTGVTVRSNSSTQFYGRVQYAYKTSSSWTTSGTNLSTLTGTANTALSYHLSNTAFKPYVNSSTRYFRNGRTYKWIAVWKP